MNALLETYNKGFLEVYTGPMRSGKSLRLIQRLDRLDYNEISYLLFKPETDRRDKNILSSRAMKKEYKCKIINSENTSIIMEEYQDELKNNSKKVVAIDEVQFFDLRIKDTIDALLKQDVNVIVAGLDTDFRGEPFEITSYLLSQADIVHKLHAVCEYKLNGKRCKGLARMTQRLENGEPADYYSPIILPGDVEEGYEPRCRKHHFVKNHPRNQ